MGRTQADKSEILFGSYDKEKFTGEIQWHSVIDKLFWSLKLDDIKLNGVPFNLCTDKTCMITPDTGTSLITVPSWAYKIMEPKMPYL